MQRKLPEPNYFGELYFAAAFLVVKFFRQIIERQSEMSARKTEARRFDVQIKREQRDCFETVPNVMTEIILAVEPKTLGFLRVGNLITILVFNITGK